MHSSQFIACTSCGAMVDPLAKQCPTCGNKFTQEQKIANTKSETAQSQPDLEAKLVDDQPYAGAAPALFKIKRKGRGSKWEIKDENKKKFLEAKYVIWTHSIWRRILERVILGPRFGRKSKRLEKEIKAGNIKEFTLYTLQDAQKSAFGEISAVVSNNLNEKQLRLALRGLGSFRIKNSSGNNLATLQGPFKSRTYYSRELVNPELYQIETGSESFHLDVTQEERRVNLSGIGKYNYISNIDILDSRNKKCLSLIPRRSFFHGRQFEATLFQGMSPLVANSLVVLLAQSIWPATTSSSHGHSI
ncbi:MAG: hypothetical protein ACXABG_12315 [Promethearchaeota archaeon]